MPVLRKVGLVWLVMIGLVFFGLEIVKIFLMSGFVEFNQGDGLPLSLLTVIFSSVIFLTFIFLLLYFVGKKTKTQYNFSFFIFVFCSPILLMIHVFLMLMVYNNEYVGFERIPYLMLMFGVKGNTDWIFVFFPSLVVLITLCLLFFLDKKVNSKFSCGFFSIMLFSLLLLFFLPSHQGAYTSTVTPSYIQMLKTYDDRGIDVDQRYPNKDLKGPIKLKNDGQKNIVIIVLETVGYSAFQHAAKNKLVMPYLNEISNVGISAKSNYVVMPATTKALTSILCGYTPFISEYAFGAASLPRDCLPKMLKSMGYENAFFRASSEKFDNQKSLVVNIGFDHIVSPESLLASGERVNFLKYDGFNENELIPYVKPWLETNKNKKTLTVFLTSMSHAPYTLPEGYKESYFDDDVIRNQYLNAVRFTDTFVKNIFDLYKAYGMYDDSIFVIVGDHGEAFGEHGRHGHTNGMFNEGLKVPMIFYGPRVLKQRAINADIASHLDILPTLFDALDIEVEGELEGHSLFDDKGERVIYSSAITPALSVARIDENFKYIHFFDKKQDMIFSLRDDNSEKINLINTIDAALINKYKSEVLAWYYGNRNAYNQFYQTLYGNYRDVLADFVLPCNVLNIRSAERLNNDPEGWLSSCN